jgi:hypothetical protein
MMQPISRPLWAAIMPVFLLFFLGAKPQAEKVYLTPPGLRAVKDPSLVIPALHPYLNRPPAKPVYRNSAGKPVPGWRRRYIDTRRFASNHSAWMYYRVSDLTGSETVRSVSKASSLRVWPAGTTIVLESYRGNARTTDRSGLMEILVMQKMDHPAQKPFYPAAWSYARFNVRGEPDLTSARVRECHQCHSIAFRLTGDLVFSQFP